jgi:hypothetical protein
MHISQKTIEKLRLLINEETEYRSGPQLVSFFNKYGFMDSYGNGFPSRWIYTESKIQALNGTPGLDKCIKDLFTPVNFIGRFTELDDFISDFNQYLCFDGWNVIRKGHDITFSRANKVDIENEKRKEQNAIDNEADFLKEDFADISIEKLHIDSFIVPFLEARINEIKLCLTAKSSLSVIFLAGSTLEGVLLGLALNNPSMYNQAKSAPKNIKTEKVKNFNDWTLSNLIDVSCELGFLREDVKKFSHSLRDFRNYIHPYQQMSENFFPDDNTAKICFQVLKAALFQISQKSK